MGEVDSWSKDLQCFWKAFEVVADGDISITLREGNCTDMSGAIRLATALMPDVKIIRTYSGTERDTFYVRMEGGKWEARAIAWDGVVEACQ